MPTMSDAQIGNEIIRVEVEGVKNPKTYTYNKTIKQVTETTILQ